MADPYGSHGYGSNGYDSNGYGSNFPPSWSYGGNGEYGCYQGYDDSEYAFQGPPEQPPPPGPSHSHGIHGYGDSRYSSQGPTEQSGPSGPLPSHGITAQTPNYGYVDSSSTTNFTTQVPGYNPFLGTRGESTTGNMIIANSNTNMSSGNTKDNYKPVKVQRKKVTRKKEPANKKSASAYAHFFRDIQARIKEVNKSASFGDISKIVAQEWEALSIDEKAGYKRKAENEKNQQFKDIALSRAMAVAGTK